MRLIDAEELEKEIHKWMSKAQDMWMDSAIPPIENLFVSIMMTIEAEPTVDAVPVEMIQKRIDALKEVADAEFELNGGYVGSAFSLVCSLEGLLREWAEGKEE